MNKTCCSCKNSVRPPLKRGSSNQRKQTHTFDRVAVIVAVVLDNAEGVIDLKFQKFLQVVLYHQQPHVQLQRGDCARASACVCSENVVN